MKVLATILLALTLFSCTKQKITRTLPKFSLKYNGVYTESNSLNANFHKVQLLNNTYEYYIAIPCADSYLQLHVDTDSLYTGTFDATAAMTWQNSTTYFGYIDVDFTAVSTTATGTFSGAVWNVIDSDTLYITDGTFLNINYP